MEEHYNLRVLADKAYIKAAIAQALAHYNQVQLITLPKSNQTKQVRAEQQWLHNHFRQIVETVNGQLTEQFNIEENYAEGFWGLTSRLYTMLSGHTLCLYLNQVLGKAEFLQIRNLAFPEII